MSAQCVGWDDEEMETREVVVVKGRGKLVTLTRRVQMVEVIGKIDDDGQIEGQ